MTTACLPQPMKCKNFLSRSLPTLVLFPLIRGIIHTNDGVRRLRSTPKNNPTQPYTILHNPTQSYTTLHNPTQLYTILHNPMKAKYILPIASVQGKIAHGYYARILHGKTIIQRCPVRTKPATPAQLRIRRQFGERYGTARKTQTEDSEETDMSTYVVVSWWYRGERNSWHIYQLQNNKE